ncbi:hypothetical protein [Leptospira borgpetersenii]|nr:hypothetical protein [Leptospira borgpetersenii]
MRPALSVQAIEVETAIPNLIISLQDSLTDKRASLYCSEVSKSK